MNYKKTTLSNGLRVLTIPMQSTQTVTVVVMVGVGSRYESEKLAGISHFLEHMMFKGTVKRPTTLDISSTLDAVGGEYNAATGKDVTLYYAKVGADKTDLALDVISDLFLNSKIDAEEIEREKGTIIQELNMYEDNPRAIVSDLFEQLLYPQNPLGRDIIGYKKTIRSFKRNDFVNYMKKFYVANDTVVCVAGKFPEKKMLSQIKKIFAPMEKRQKPKLIKVSDSQDKPQVKLRFKKTDQTHLVLGTRAYSLNHPDRFSLGLLSIILGGNMSSRLFMEVRERRGLAYSVFTTMAAFDDCGYLAAQAGVDHGKVDLTIKTILDEFQKIAHESVNQEELQKAKDFLKGKSVMSLESSDEVSMFFIDQELKRKKVLTPEQVFKKIDAVTAGDIKRIAQKIFWKDGLNLAIIGPHRDAKKFQKLLKL